MDHHELLGFQRAFFRSGSTTGLKWRKSALKRLRNLIADHEAEWKSALYQDFGKSGFETYTTELGPCLQEIDHIRRHLESWMAPRAVSTNQLIHFWSRAKIEFQPKGQVLIICPWNYPLYLLFPPLAGALAAGCTAIVKPSEHLPITSALTNKLVAAYFDKTEVCVVEGNAECARSLLKLDWDHIFFTGSTQVGKRIMESASKSLSSITLELGGKCPVFIDESANLKVAARRLAWGKLVNAGQTCVAPDHIWVHQSVAEDFVSYLKEELRTQYEQLGEDYCRIIHKPAFERLLTLGEHPSAWKAGHADEERLHFPPVLLMMEKESTHPSMAEEIFGPVLPILTFEKIEEIEECLPHRSAPLATYYFGSARKKLWRLLHDRSRSGALVRNEVLMHLAHHRLPFGGVGESGMGAYHGEHSFRCFSNERSMLQKSNWPDPAIRYAPYRGKLKWLKMLFRLS